MKRLATAAIALTLAAGSVHAAGMGVRNERPDATPTEVHATAPISVPASAVLSARELSQRGISAKADVTVSDFSSSQPHSYER